MTQTLILGGPGTGKTTRLLDVVDSALSRGVAPSRIAFLGFTNAAADEAKGRAMERFALDGSALPHFRTIHSLCFRALGLTRGQIVGQEHLRELIDLTGEELTLRSDDPTAPALGSSGDALLFLNQVSRVTGASLEATWHDHGGDVDWWRLQRFSAAYEGYKRDLALVDFADLLERYASGEGAPLDVDLAIVDEAQDLTQAQWRVVRRAVATAADLYVAGDDDQAVHRWAGADVEQFLALKYQREELPVSHRVPRSVFELARSVAARVLRRFPKAWRPTDKAGTVDFIVDPDEAELGAGSWLILARARSQLLSLAAHIRSRGLLYSIKGHGSVNPDHLRAITAYERQRAGGAPWTTDEARSVLAACGVRRTLPSDGRAYAAADLGVDLSRLWHDALVGIALDEREYYLTARRNGEKLTQPPRLRLDTLHGAKGREADHVLLLSDLTPRARRGLELDPDSEHRVFYVGVTRARKSLHVVVSRRPGGYTL